MSNKEKNISEQAKLVKETLDKPVVLIGMMGSGKTHIGRLLAHALDMEFIDSDQKIEAAAGCSIAEIFERDGEARFRESEKRIIGELLDAGPIVLATGGGAIMNEGTMAAILGKAISIRIDADIDTLVKRTRDSIHRPLLDEGNPKVVIERLLKQRGPIYAKADITVQSAGNAVSNAADKAVAALYEFLNKMNK